MSQHFLLSSKARTRSVRKIASMSVMNILNRFVGAATRAIPFVRLAEALHLTTLQKVDYNIAARIAFTLLALQAERYFTLISLILKLSFLLSLYSQMLRKVFQPYSLVETQTFNIKRLGFYLIKSEKALQSKSLLKNLAEQSKWTEYMSETI